MPNVFEVPGDPFIILAVELVPTCLPDLLAIDYGEQVNMSVIAIDYMYLLECMVIYKFLHVQL